MTRWCAWKGLFICNIFENIKQFLFLGTVLYKLGWFLTVDQMEPCIWNILIITFNIYLRIQAIEVLPTMFHIKADNMPNRTDKKREQHYNGELLI